MAYEGWVTVISLYKFQRRIILELLAISQQLLQVIAKLYNVTRREESELNCFWSVQFIRVSRDASGIRKWKLLFLSDLQ